MIGTRENCPSRVLGNSSGHLLCVEREGAQAKNICKLMSNGRRLGSLVRSLEGKMTGRLSNPLVTGTDPFCIWVCLRCLQDLNWHHQRAYRMCVLPSRVPTSLWTKEPTLPQRRCGNGRITIESTVLLHTVPTRSCHPDSAMERPFEDTIEAPSWR